MRMLARIILFSALFSAAFSDAHAELARIGMVHFTGNVESAGYLGTSLASAIDDSLKKKFAYQRIGEDKIKSVLDDLSKVGIFDPRKIPEKNNLLRIAVALKADILIYGSYGIIPKAPLPAGQKPPEQDSTQISMKTYVYYVNENRTAELPELKPLLDGSIFEAINTSAENVVAEFKKITVETETDGDMGSIPTAATLRMVWLPVVAEKQKDANSKAVKALYENIAEGVYEERDAIRISAESVQEYAAQKGWRHEISAATATHTQFFGDAANGLKSDLVFWGQVETQGKKKYLVVSGYHAQLRKVLFSLREEIGGKSAAKLSREILAQLNSLRFAVTAQIAGLKGSGLVLEFGGNEFAIQPGETLKDFGKTFASGEQFNLAVKNHPKEPRQVCHVRNAQGSVTFKNVEILITCITETVPLVVKTIGFFGDELLLSLDGREDMKVTGIGEQQFKSRVEDLQAFDLSILSLPKRPAQSCRVGEPSKLADAKAIEVAVECRKSVEHQLSGYLGYPAMGSLGASTSSIQVDNNFPMGKMSSLLAVGIVYQVKNLLPYNFLLGTQANFSAASATLPVQMFAGDTSADTVKTNLLRADLSAFTAYPFPLPYRLELLPYAGFGFSYQTLWRSGGSTLSSGLTPLVSLGAILQYDFQPQLKLLFKTGPDLYFYKNGENLMVWSFSFGVGKQFL